MHKPMVRLTNSPDRPLTEAEIVDATLAFANGARLEIDGLERRNADNAVGDEKLAGMLKVYALMYAHKVKIDGKLAAPTPPTATNVEEYRTRHRAAVRATLAEIVSDPASAAAAFARSDLADQIAVSAVLRAPPADLLTHRYAFSTYAELVGLGEILLADSSRPFQSKLCQCLYSECGNFFFEMKAAINRRGGGGMRRRKYCCDDHMNWARDERRTARAAAARNAPRRPK